MKKYIIALVDMEYGYPPIYLASFGDGFGTVPNRNDAFVVDESVVDEYVQKAQKMSDEMELTFSGSTKHARKAVKWFSLN